MSGWMQSWLSGIAGVSLCLAAADGLTPEGAVKQVGRLAGGLVLFLAVFRPLAGVDFAGLLENAAAADWQAAAPAAALEEVNEQLTADIIAGQLSSYIEAKGAELGASVRAEVMCRQAEGAVFLPASVCLRGQFPGGSRLALTQWIAAELGIPPERQSYMQEGAG